MCIQHCLGSLKLCFQSKSVKLKKKYPRKLSPNFCRKIWLFIVVVVVSLPAGSHISPLYGHNFSLLPVPACSLSCTTINLPGNSETAYVTAVFVLRIALLLWAGNPQCADCRPAACCMSRESRVCHSCSRCRSASLLMLARVCDCLQRRSQSTTPTSASWCPSFSSSLSSSSSGTAAATTRRSNISVSQSVHSRAYHSNFVR